MSRFPIAYGSHVKRLKSTLNQPFGEEPVVGVACGLDPDGGDLFIAIDTTNRYSISRDGEFWSDPLEIDGADIEGIMFGGGMFLIWCSDGYVYRSVWRNGVLDFVPQTSSPLDTAGLYSIAFSDGLFVGVGTDGKAVSSVDADGWILETTPDGTPTLLHVFVGNGEFVAVGTGGTIISTTDGKAWTKRTSGRTEDFYAGYYYDGLYLVAGKDGVLIASEGLAKGWSSPYPTGITSIIRVVHRHNGVYLLGSDAGQIAACATFAEILGMIFETDTLSPYNDLPLPLQEYADPGISNRYARGDHVHSWDGLVTVIMVGKPGGVASLDERGRIPDSQLGKGEPDGVPPLENGLVPKRYLPPLDVNVIIDGMKNNLEFVEVNSCFKRGPLVSSILHAGASLADVVVLVGEAGIGYSRNVLDWHLVEHQPFAGPVIGVASGLDFDGVPLLIAIDTQRSYSISRDGETWSEKITLDGDYDFSHISYYNRTFSIVSTNGQILRSVWTGDGLVFTEQEDGPEFTRGVSRICGGNGLWVGVGNGGVIRVSGDVSHFTPVESPTTKNLYAIACGKATFVAGGEDGEIIVGDGTEFEAGAKPFAGNADIMGLAYIDTIGTFIVTNRAGEVAVSTDAKAWASIPSTSSVAIRAITTGLNAIVIGDDLGDIAASRKVFEFGDIGSGNLTNGNVKVGRRIGIDEYGYTIGRLIDREGEATGETLRNVIMLKPGRLTATVEQIQVEI